MKVFKVILCIALPVLIFLNLWRLIYLGDEFEYQGLKFTYQYLQTFPSFEHFYTTLISSGDYFTVHWYDVVGSALVPGFITAKMLFGVVYLIGNLLFDVILIVIWFFGWIFQMVGV